MRYLITALILCACNNTPIYYVPVTNVTDYEIPEPNQHSPSGVPVYSEHMLLDLYLLDGIVEYTELCLGITLDRSQAMVYVPSDVYISPCSGQQLFPCSIVEANGRDVCHEDKGLNTSEDCPCNCRSVIQDNSVIITTPDFRLLGMTLVMLMTSEINPYIKHSECIFSLEWLEGGV